MEKKKKKFNTKQIVLYGILSFILPNIFLINVYDQEFGIIALSSLGILAVILGVINTMIVVILTLLTKKAYYSMVITTVMCTIFWTYNEIYFISAPHGITSKYLFPCFFIVFLLMTILFRILKENRYMKILIPLMIAIVGFMNLATFSFKLIAYEKDHKAYVFNTETVALDEELPTPNVYWIHCDGMLSFAAVDQYFGYSDSEFLHYLQDEQFMINEDAWMEMEHTTMKAIPAMTCPNYYDNVLRDYMDQMQSVLLNNGMESYNVITSSELVDCRIENELVRSFEQRGYQTNVIANFDSFFCFYSDTFYELNGPQSNAVEVNYPKENYSEFEYHFRVDMKKLLLTETMLTAFYTMTEGENQIPCETNSDSWFYHGGDEKLMKTETAWEDLLATNATSPQFTFISVMTAHSPFCYDEYGNIIYVPSGDPNETGSLSTYVPSWIYTGELVEEMVDEIIEKDPNAVIVIQGDHGCHQFSAEAIKEYFQTDQDEVVLDLWNSVMSAVYVPQEYQTGDENYLNNPANISRYLVNHYVGENYDYVE